MVIRPLNSMSLISLELECSNMQHIKQSITKIGSRDNRDIRDTREGT